MHSFSLLFYYEAAKGNGKYLSLALLFVDAKRMKCKSRVVKRGHVTVSPGEITITGP